MSKLLNRELDAGFERKLYFKSAGGYHPFNDMCGKDLREYSIDERIEIVRTLPRERNFDVSFSKAPPTTLRELQKTLIKTYVVPMRIFN